MTQAEFKFRRGNPDVLTSIANLSNDEVFTPPEFANKMLDTLKEAWAASNNGANIWEDSTVTFLDPFTKSGVFLREITERLTHGLEKQIPDLQERVNHILTKQVFGIAITQLTSLLARRSVYCSKWANGEHSIVSAFDNPDGNIWFERTEHTWVGGKKKVIVVDENGDEVTKTTNAKCKYCGASQKDYDRGKTSETHAYAFIHLNEQSGIGKKYFGEQMKFDVIIGNPPYQLDDGGFGTSAVPIYQHFVEQAKKLEPRFLSVVIPSRWFTGGKGLEGFRQGMLADTKIREIHDFPDSSEVFPGVQIKGGVCYFLWESDYSGQVRVNTWRNSLLESSMKRALLEPGLDVFIRYNEAVAVLQKVANVHNSQKLLLNQDESFIKLVSFGKPFGLRTFFKGKINSGKDSVKVYQNGGIGFVEKSDVEKNVSQIDNWKIFIPAAGSGSDSFPHSILGKPFVGEPGSICTETYNMIGPFSSKEQAKNAISYIQTRFFRFLVLLHKSSQHANRNVYTFVPMEDFSQPISDQFLYEKYLISEKEVEFIESLIRPMGDSDE